MRKDLLIVNLVSGMRDLLTDNFPGTETVSFIFLPGPASEARRPISCHLLGPWPKVKDRHCPE